ncbi:MAG: hypothetical protein GY841_08255 [FCB group bacterium]|nr:hypothetical protein [FCB group bacterium]
MSSSILNILVKIIAVLLAIFLWFNVITKKQYDYELTLPVSEIDFPAGLGPVNKMPDSLTIKVSATGKKLLRDDWKASGMRLKATRLRRGMTNLELNSETVSLIRSEDVTLLDISGISSFPIQLDRIDSVLKPIASRLVVIPAEGHMIVAGTGDINPIRTQVIGPVMLLNRIDSIYTEQRIIDNAEDSINLILDLEIPEEMILTLGHDSAEVTLMLDRVKGRVFEDLPITFQDNQSSRRTIVDPQRIRVEVEGPQNLIDNLDAVNIRPSIKPNGLMRTGYVVPEIFLPANVRLIRITPDSVRMLVSP